MQVLMCERHELDTGITAVECVLEDVRLRRRNDRVPMLPPQTVEHAIARRAIRLASTAEARFVSRWRPLVYTLTLWEIPVQRLGRLRGQRRRELLAGGMPETANCPREWLRHQHAYCPSRQRSEELGVPIDEQPEIDRDGLGDQVEKDMLAPLAFNADGELVREEPPSARRAGAKPKMWIFVERQGVAEEPHEVPPLVGLGAEPREAAVGKDGVEHHESLDHPADRIVLR